MVKALQGSDRMSEQRFIVESVEIISDCNENEKRIAKVITDTDELYSYEDLYEIKDLLNEQQATISALKEENRELRKELNDCEKFRYTVFKRIGELNVERK